MTVTVIKWQPWSEADQNKTAIQIGYLLIDKKNAIKMFLKEYPEAKIEELTSFEFDSKERPDLYSAFDISGCLRFWKNY